MQHPPTPTATICSSALSSRARADHPVHALCSASSSQSARERFERFLGAHCEPVGRQRLSDDAVWLARSRVCLLCSLASKFDGSLVGSTTSLADGSYVCSTRTKRPTHSRLLVTLESADGALLTTTVTTRSLLVHVQRAQLAARHRLCDSGEWIVHSHTVNMHLHFSQFIKLKLINNHIPSQ